jgi:hypothetical protein
MGNLTLNRTKKGLQNQQMELVCGELVKNDLTPVSKVK